MSDIAALMWRERFLMGGVFLAVFLLGAAFSTTLKTTFQAHSSLLVQLGQEYVYQPSVGDAGRGVALTPGQIMQSELAILQSAQVKERVIRRLGLTRLFPSFARSYARASGPARRAIEGAAVKALESGLKVAAAPETSVVQLNYVDRDPDKAALILNTLVDEYLTYRKTVLVGDDPGVLGEQRRDFEARLKAADLAYQAFLTGNGVGDFEAEKAAMGQIYSSLLTERYSIQAQLSEADGRLGVTSRQASQAPAEIGLYQDQDQTASTKLTQLRVDRQDLLSRYKPDAQPVREIDQKIAALQALASQGSGAGVSARRVGPNPVYQTLQTEKNQLEAQAASLRQRAGAVAADLAQVAARRQKLVELEPQYQDLVRDRDVLATNVRNFTAREQEAEAARAIALKGEDNIRVVERALTPTKGASLKKPVLALAFLFAAFTGLCAGLVRIFLRRGFVTPHATARSLDLPVLATAAFKRAG